MDNDVADSISGHLSFLNGCTAGGRIRFKTNSSSLSLKVCLGKVWGTSVFSKKHSVSFSVYVNNKFYKLISPSKNFEIDDNDEYVSAISLGDSKIKKIDIYFPLYTFIKDVWVGILEESKIYAARNYKHNIPIVFYGSSTTQGCCASRPGNTYISLLSRALDFDYINLGFSGNCKSEILMAEYISKLKMSVFVFDYDYNAETVEELRETHEPFFKYIRKNNPDLPIILLPKPCDEPSYEEFEKRKEIIRQTYENAVLNGDNNVYYVDYKSLYTGFAANSQTVDGCHPNDLGFYLMAKEILQVLKKILKEDKNNG
jgi:lysophospholipase L1-like esterase